MRNTNYHRTSLYQQASPAIKRLTNTIFKESHRDREAAIAEACKRAEEAEAEGKTIHAQDLYGVAAILTNDYL